MQIYGLRLFNFLRYGEVNNSVVFDVTDEQKIKIENETSTLDILFDDMKKNPVGCVEQIKSYGMSGILGIAGAIAGNEDRSNGVGKSAILEGICYSLFGKIVRKNVNTDKIEGAGKSIVTRINGKYPESLKESYVEAIFEEQGKIYRLKRDRSFSKSKKSDQPILEFECYNAEDVDSQTGHRTGDTDEAVAKVINMDYDVFVNSVMFGQSDAGKFLTGTDKTRKEMLVSLLHLENAVNGCLDISRDRKGKCNKEIEATQSQLEAIEKIIKESIPSETILEEWKQGNKNLEEVVKEGVKLFNSYIEKYKKEIKQLDENSKKLDKEIATLANSEVLSKIEAIKADGKKVKAEKTSKVEQMDAQAKQWKDIYATSQDQSKSASNRLVQAETKTKRLDVEAVEKQKQIDTFNEGDHKKGLEKAKKAKEVKQKYVDGIAKFRKQLEDINTEQATFRSHKDLAEKSIKQLQAQLADGQNVFTCSQCRSNVTRDHIEKEVSDFQKKADEASANEKKEAEKKQTLSDKLKDADEKLSKINDMLEMEFVSGRCKDEWEFNKKELDKNKSDKEEAVKSITSAKDEIEKATKQQEECKVKAGEIKKQFSDDINNLTVELNSLASDLKSAEEAAKDVKGKIDKMELERKNLTSQKADLNSKIGAVQNRIKDIQSRMGDADKLSVSLQGLKKNLHRLLLLEGVFGLDGIQTRIVKKYLPLLNVYIKEFLDILSNGEMAVEMVINDKGKVDILISGGQADTFPMLSGGEKMIVRLAVDIGLALLSFSRCAQKPEMICLDEIFGPLDNSHTEAVFRLLATLKGRFSRVLVISHKTEINDLIQNKIIIEKGAGSLGLSEIKRIA